MRLARVTASANLEAMTTHEVETATAAEETAVFAVLTLAFSSDPATRWTWPGLPPGVGPDDAAIGALMQRTADVRTAVDGPQIMQQMARYHPKEPHWYLPLIGIDPAHQGKGLGGSLMKHATDICDRDGVLAYLESSNLRNVPLYERHGFKVLGTIQAGGSPPITPMLRKPRRR